MASPAPNGSAPYPPSPGGHSPHHSAGFFEWRHFFQTLLERGWLVALLALVGGGLALAYLAKSPRLYQSHLLLEVQTQDPSLVDVGGGTGSGPRPPGSGGGANLNGQEALRTIEQNLRNGALLVRVLRSEGLLGAEGARTLLGAPASAVPGATAGPAPSDESLAGALSSMISASIRRGTRLIDVNVVHRDPALARRLAEAVGREYIRSSIERRHDFAQEALRFLLEEAERLKNNLQKSEQAISDYKARTPDALALGGGAAATGSASGGGGGRGGLAESKLEELSSKLTAAKAERLRLEEALSQVERAAGVHSAAVTDALLGLPAIASAPAVAERRRELAQVQANVAALSQRYKDKHPKMLAARAALEQAQAAVAQTVAAEPALIRSAVESARATEAGLAEATREQEQAALALNRASIGYQELARQAETDRALYESVLRQIKQTDLAKEANRADAVSIAEHASTPGGPVSPRPIRTIATGLLGGLVAGLGLIGLLSAMDRSVQTVDQAEALFGLPVLAAVPEVDPREQRRQRRQGKTAASQPEPVRGGEAAGPADEEQAEAAAAARTSGALAEAAAPEGLVAEAFRSLRAALSLLGPESERRVYLFTSALPGEGKSFTSANYALCLAQQGQRVLLIDGDLRRPSLHRVFGLDGGAEGKGERRHGGVVDYLVGGGGRSRSNGQTVDGQEVPTVPALAREIELPGVAPAGGGKLCVMTAGRRAPNPAELLSSGGGAGFGQLIAEALEHFDRVVIDSAPVLAVSDTLLLLPFAQTTCVVVRAGKTARNALGRALTLLSQAANSPHVLPSASASAAGGMASACAGLVLNRLPRRRGVGYYYYYSEHGYGEEPAEASPPSQPILHGVPARPARPRGEAAAPEPGATVVTNGQQRR